MHQPLVVKRTTKYLAWKCNAVFASTRIHFISFQGFYREYRAVQGLINDRGHLFRRDTHFILLNVKLFTAKLYIFRRKWWVFIVKVPKKIPTQIFWHFTVGRGGQTNIHIFFFGLTSAGFVNPNTFAGLVGKVRIKLSPGRKEGWRKKAHAARPLDPGLEPGTCRVLG